MSDFMKFLVLSRDKPQFTHRLPSVVGVLKREYAGEAQWEVPRLLSDNAEL